MRKLMETVENVPYFDEIVDVIENNLKQFAEEMMEYETDDTSHPSAPDTTKFRASSSGKIKLVTNHTLFGEYHSRTNYPMAVLIGGNVNMEVYNNAVDDLHEFAEYFPHKKSGKLLYHFPTKDNITVVMAIEYGTNYSTYGYTVIEH